MLAYCSSTEHEENCKYPMEEGYALFINNDEISNIYNKNPPENGGFVSSLGFSYTKTTRFLRTLSFFGKAEWFRCTRAAGANREKLVATAKRRERVYKRTVEPSVTFHGKGGAAACACSDVAERKGFEPLNGYQPLHDFQSCALNQLSHLSIDSIKLTVIYYNILKNICQEKNRKF